MDMTFYNYKVITASDGHEALNLLKNGYELPDLILLDIMMPEISGWDVLDIIKSNENWKKIPVILLTALAQEKDIKMGMEKQVDGYITKPFEKKYLLEKVNELILKCKKRTINRIFRLLGYSINNKHIRCKYGGNTQNKKIWN
jgi:DNA-binding response OmpR family regulator